MCTDGVGRSGNSAVLKPASSTPSFHWTKVQWFLPFGSYSLQSDVIGSRLSRRPLLLRTSMSQRIPLIAIVDDDASVCRAMKRLLHSLGLCAETFSSGQEFLELLQSLPSFHPDCVVLDVQMPGMTGFEVQQQLGPLGLPVIFITAHDEACTRERALAAGAVAFLRKPFNDEIFIKTLHTALHGLP
jgi:CheY-like chemotaxis protein